MKVVTVSEMRALERRTFDSGVSEPDLMERAGAAIASAVAAYLPRTERRLVLVLAGKGNNGGDALIAARHLRDRHGMRLAIYLTSPRGDDPLLASLRDVDAVVHGSRSVQRLRALLADADLVLDGILGVGARLPLTGAIAAALEVCRAVRPPTQRRIAIDVPTGVDADTGSADPLAFQADVTLATGPLKPGLLIHPGAAHAGRARALDIGLTDPDPGGAMRRLDDRTVASLLPDRPDDSHKGSYGKVLVVAGSDRYVGAASLVAGAAIRGGAGLVTLACPPAVKAALAGASPETTYLPLVDDPAAAGRLTAGHLGPLLDAAHGAGAIAIGPGLGDAPETRRLVILLLERLATSGATVVLDADGLNALAASASDGWPEPTPGSWVLTPHPGEMARLAKLDPSEVQTDRLALALRKAAEWGHVVVLKGAPAIIASPDGRARLGVFANAALAVGGTGDVLTGLTAALLAQRLDPFDAASAATHVHGAAGELWRAQHGAAGLPASALAELLPTALRRVRDSYVA
ncbi:MAG TPA: NAD(P)H-hydrate dehydratase [Chloroflexota bacterium]|nr:NAD(P)H-hydrate dehydratase [Chloroflexota bacterium]